MRKLSPHEQQLVTLAHQILLARPQLFLPHHFNSLAARLETFRAIQVLDINLKATYSDGLPLHIFLLTRPRQKVSLPTAWLTEDVLFLDLSSLPATSEALQTFFLTTEENRRWHHAPHCVIAPLAAAPFPC